MAQASKIHSEPSMEEILASIRRIIEESEAPQAAGSPPKTGDNDDAVRAALRASNSEAKAPRPGGAPFAREPAVEAPGPAPVTAPIAGDAVGERGEAGVAAPVAPEPKAPPVAAKPAAPAARTGESFGAEPPRRPAAPAGIFAPGATRSGSIAASLSPDAREPGSGKPDPAVPAAVAHRSGPPVAGPPAGAERSRPAIISEAAGRQVAAAFEELSEAFAQSRRRSFDEIAEEMMRPMLQEWLDNNLPVLVERLVREEIDRVARGASR
jgi:cell pole-organizing protein PopZ